MIPTNIASEAPRSIFLVRSVDRCDQCGAQAQVRVVIVASGLPLLFCGHHYQQQASALAAIAAVTHDER
jgi:hypothetical protein